MGTENREIVGLMRDEWLGGLGAWLSGAWVLSLPEYVEHLKDEAQVCAIIERVQRYLEEKGTTEEICRIYLRRILHTYYKFDYKAHQRQLTPPEGSSKVSARPPCQRAGGVSTGSAPLLGLDDRSPVPWGLAGGAETETPRD